MGATLTLLDACYFDAIARKAIKDGDEAFKRVDAQVVKVMFPTYVIN
jgi:hypothetical protein